jgi:CheY-like chemotaxis protein
VVGTQKGRGPRSVLIVDDQKEILESMKRSLESQGIEVHTLTDPRLVVSYLEKYTQISMVLLDVDMPYLNGVEIQRLIRQNLSDRSDLKVKFMSGLSEGELHHTLGISRLNFISKPFGLNDIVDFLEEKYPDRIDRSINPEDQKFQL